MVAHSVEMWEIASERFVQYYCPQEAIYVRPCCKAMHMFLETAGPGISPTNWKLGSGSGGIAGELGLAAPAGAETIVPVVVAIIAAVFSELSQRTPPITKQAILSTTEKYTSQFQARGYLTKQMCESLPGLWFNLCQPSGTPADEVSFILDFAPETVTVKVNSKKINQLSKQAPWQFLEFLLMRFNEPVHWIWGFVIFRTWQTSGKIEDPQKTLRTRRTRLQNTLNEIDPQLKVSIENVRYSPFWTLTEANFDSNVVKARDLCMDAETALCNGDLAEAFEKSSQAFDIHHGNTIALRINAACFIRSDFKGTRMEDVKSFFRNLSQAAVDYGGAVQAIKGLERSIIPADQAVADVIEQWSQELNEYTEAFEAFLDARGELSLDYIECKKFVSLAYDFHRNKGDQARQDDIFHQIRKLPFTNAIRENTASMFVKYYGSEVEQAFQSEFCKVIMGKKIWRFNSTERLINYFTKVLKKRTPHEHSLPQKTLTASQERQVREYLEARQSLIDTNSGRKPSEQQLCEYLGWDEATYLEIRDLAQPMLRYEEPGQQHEDK
jgi:hypothetical protein